MSQPEEMHGVLEKFSRADLVRRIIEKNSASTKDKATIAALVEALKCALTHEAASPGQPNEEKLPACCQYGDGIITCSLEQMLEAALKLAGEGRGHAQDSEAEAREVR